MNSTPNKVNTPMNANGMATLRIISKPYVHTFFRCFNPIIYLYKGYKVHIDIDNNSYVHKSKNKQIDIPVAPGEHFIRISATSKKSAKAMAIAGQFGALAGAATGSSSTFMAGAAMEDIGNFIGKAGFKYQFSPNEVVTIKVKHGLSDIVIDN